MQLKDVEKLPAVAVSKSNHPFLYTPGNTGAYDATKKWLDSNLQHSLSYSFLVIKNDSIIYENYFGKYDSTTLFPSFSVMKTFASTLVGIALAEGKIKSLNEPMTNYLPEFLKKDKRFAAITIQHLLDMRTGIIWNEGGYNLKDDAIKMGFRPNIRKYAKKIKIGEQAVSDEFEYKSINTLLLVMILVKATGSQYEKYFEEKLWQPMGAVHAATITTDKKGFPIGFAGLNASARDFAKLGTLFLKNGFMNGRQVISPGWVKNTVTEESMNLAGGYHNQWWSYAGNGLYAFYATGILNQLILAVPQKNMVIVRTGHYWSHNQYWEFL